MSEAGLPSEEFTYKVIQAIFEVYNEIGFGYQEKYYYRALKPKFIAFGFNVQEQLLARLIFQNQPIGRYYLDFLLNNCLVVELKIANQIYQKHINQVLGYLKANNLKLGMLAVYTKQRVLIKRIIN